MQLHTLEADQITRAATWQDASAVAGRIDPLNAQSVKEAYIRYVFGRRATGGYFNPTAANVNEKFAAAWEAAQSPTAP